MNMHLDFLQVQPLLWYLLIFYISEGMYFSPHRSSRSSDRKCLLGIILFGTRNPTRWTDAIRQDHRRRR